MKKKRTGILVGAGGNKVFFSNGVLSVLNEEEISISKVVGFSSSAPIALAYAYNSSQLCVNIFSGYLQENKKNFYIARKDHFPHNSIYSDSVSELISALKKKRSHVRVFLFAATTSARWVRLKSFIATFVLALDSMGANTKSVYRKLFKITAEQREIISVDKELLNFIMGSSTIYPFIRPQIIGDQLIQEGALLNNDPSSLLSDCEKMIEIHTEQGSTHINGDVLHIYPDERIGRNMFDYTSPSKIIMLHQAGVKQMQKDLDILKKFIRMI